MDFVLYLVLAATLQRLPAVPPASLPSTATVMATRASANLILALPADISALQPGSLVVSATPQRPRAIEYSSFYYTRLEIHKIASLATAPLFVAEYLLGQKLISDSAPSSSTRNAHQLVAVGIGGLFAVNTVTGAWNLWDSRKDPTGRARRYLHAALMIAADAGFVATAAAAPGGRRFRASGPTAANTHRTLAIASMSTALASYVMMLLWKN